MPCHARAALAAAVLTAALALPAAAGERATLKVTARVVDRCTIEVPPWIPPGLWRNGKHERWLVRHECRGGPPFRIDARRVLLSQLRERLPDIVRQRGARVHEVRHPFRDDIVLITVTY